MTKGICLAAALVVSITTVACSDDSPSLAPSNSMQTFSGTVNVGSSDFHRFTVAQTGNVTVTLTSVGPPATISMGLGIGLPSAAGCPVAPNATVLAAAAMTPQLTGTLAAGTYCVEIFDVGNQTASITYSLILVHP